jgi:hypothetical protein
MLSSLISDVIYEASKKTLTNLFQKVKSEFEGTRGGNANQGYVPPKDKLFHFVSENYY